MGTLEDRPLREPARGDFCLTVNINSNKQRRTLFHHADAPTISERSCNGGEERTLYKTWNAEGECPDRNRLGGGRQAHAQYP